MHHYRLAEMVCLQRKAGTHIITAALMKQEAHGIINGWKYLLPCFMPEQNCIWGPLSLLIKCHQYQHISQFLNFFFKKKDLFCRHLIFGNLTPGWQFRTEGTDSTQTTTEFRIRSVFQHFVSLRGEACVRPGCDRNSGTQNVERKGVNNQSRQTVLE